MHLEQQRLLKVNILILYNLMLVYPWLYWRLLLTFAVCLTWHKCFIPDSIPSSLTLWCRNCDLLQRLVMHTLCWATQTKDGSMTWQEARSRAVRVTHRQEVLTSTGALRLTSLLRTSSTCSLEVVSPPVSELLHKQTPSLLMMSLL